MIVYNRKYGDILWNKSLNKWTKVFDSYLFCFGQHDSIVELYIPSWKTWAQYKYKTTQINKPKCNSNQYASLTNIPIAQYP